MTKRKYYDTIEEAERHRRKGERIYYKPGKGYYIKRNYDALSMEVMFRRVRRRTYPKIEVDKQTKTITIQLKKGKVVDSDECVITPNFRVVADFNKKGDVVSLEILW